MSDSNSSDSEDENADANGTIESLKNELVLKGSDYDLHLKLVKLCKESGELVELRLARNNFAKMFPLTEALWLEWIEDEKLVSQTDDEHSALIRLFERAIEDYMCPLIWLEYIQYAIRWISDDDGLVKFRALCERGITATGLHPQHGAQIWEAYRETESMLDGDGKVDRMTSIFKRHVSIPVYGIDETYKELKSFNQQIWKATKSSYDSAMLKLKEIEPFESDLRQLTTPKERADVWSKYIKYELKKGDPVRIEFVYERATTQLCLDPALWTQYLDWARKINSPNLPTIAKRATRNCSWEGQLWTLRLKILEEKSFSKQEIELVLTEALQCLEAGTIDRYLSLWWQFILFHKRALQLEASDDNKGSFRAAIKRAVKYIESNLAHYEEDVTVYAREFECFAARVEATFCGEMGRARTKWEKIIKTSFGQDANNWADYAQLEIQFGSIENARKIFRKGVQFSKFNSESIFEKSEKFEKVFGSLRDLEDLSALIDKKKDELARREIREIKEKKKSEERQQKNTKNFDEKTKSKLKPMAFVKQIDGAPNGEPSPKRPRVNDDTSSDDSKTIKKSEIFADFKSPFTAPSLPTIQPVKVRPPKVKPEAKKAKPEINEPKFKHAETPEEKERTVFVSNMDYRLLQPECDVRDIFIGCGEIEDVRLVRNGIIFRGYGYVLFKTKEGADNALLRDRAKIKGRPAFVSKFTDKGGETSVKAKDFKVNDGKEDHRVFVKHPNTDLTREQICEIFEKCGTVVDVRLPETRQGHRKAIFYVEFSTGLEASKASLTIHDQTILGHKIEVKISDPPKRGSEIVKEKKEFDISKTAYATPRSRFSTLVPRTIPKKVKTVPKTVKTVPKTGPKLAKGSIGDRLMSISTPDVEMKEKPKEEEKSGGMSNADFSKLFSK